jgi:hypothetical protein
MRNAAHRSTIAVLAGVALFAAASPALAGPPWISVEYPSNPHHPSTRDAAFLIRLYHHSDAIVVPVTGRAEGMVRGQRRSVDVKVNPTAFAGLYAVSDLPEEAGSWVVVITMNQGESSATALITLASDGSPMAVRVPSRRTADGWVVPVAVKNADIDAAVAQADRFAAALQQANPPAQRPAGAMLPWLLLPAGLIVVSRARRRR